MIKYFTYQFIKSNYKSYYRLIQEKENFDSFKKINYESFEILYQNSDLINFKIDTQVIRKLKLLKLNEKIKLNFNEKRLSLLLSISKEKENDDFEYKFTYSNYDYYVDYRIIINKEEIKERKRNLVNQSKMYSQKIKQYTNKSRFRKLLIIY